jgi:O-antigen ligase
MPKKTSQKQDDGFNFSFWIIFALSLLVPLAVLPQSLDNAFNAPKNLLIVAGACFMAGLYLTRLLTGKGALKTATRTPYLIIVLILLNLISFFYTKNYYFTKAAALMNISCLLVFYFTSLTIDSKKALWILRVVSFSGILVSVITCFQFARIYPVLGFKGPIDMVMGTIGNSNYLGAYLLFPLFALAGLIFLAKGWRRIIPACLFLFVFVALLFSRARASWLGLGVAVLIILISAIYKYRLHLVHYLRSHLGRVALCTTAVLVLFAVFWFAGPQRFRDTMQISKWTETTTVKLRWKYWQASLMLIKEHPVFGEGLWSYRNRVYEAQARLNESDPDYFKDYVAPKPRRVHNEYLEILNDGGLLAAALLSLFLFWFMKHGWSVIWDEKVQSRDRIITATAFYSIAGIMVAAAFFFPFRINSTLFMTALMMGIVEGMYLRNRELLSEFRGRLFPCARFFLVLCWLLLLGIFWFGQIIPFKGELAFFQYRKAFAKRDAKQAEKHILRAISYDPYNSQYCLYAGKLYMDILRDHVKAGDFFERTIINFNGDLTKWSVYYGKGLLKYRMGSLFEARDAFEKALYYYPLFEPAQKQLKKVNKVIKEHKEIKIRLR